MGQRQASEITVYVNGAPNGLFKCLTARWSAGGKQLDRAELWYDLAFSIDQLEGYRLGESPMTIEIVVTPAGGGTPYVIHWGKTSISELKLAANTEQLLITSRAEPFHFSGLNKGYLVWNPIDASIETVWDDLVFNPEVDGRVLPNCAQTMRSLGGNNIFVFLDPESTRTPQAIALSGDALPWTLAWAAHYLCWTLNWNQNNFLNPDLPTLELVLGTDPALVQNLKISRELFLPDALDALLTPFGFGWNVQYLGLGNRAITVFRRGFGHPVQVAQGLPVADDNDASDISVAYNVGNTRNYVHVQGDHVYIESTFSLVRAWETAQDILNPTTDLAKDSDNYQNNPSYQRAWRDWVLNEAGDYTLTRPEILAAFDLSTVYATVNFNGAVDLETKTVPKRRKFFPCITRGVDLAPIGETHGTVVEYSDDDGATWYPIDRLSDSSCHLLQRECGVRFDGQHVPIELYRAGDNAQVRITATVRFDRRISADAPNGDSSPQSDVAPVIVDAHSRFHFKQLSPLSKFYSAVHASGTLTADEVDDTVAIQDFANSLQAAWDMADVSGPIEIQGLDGNKYSVSDMVTGVNGLGINFDAQGVASQVETFPQIVAIEFFCQGEEQKRVLHLETYREEAGHELGVS